MVNTVVVIFPYLFVECGLGVPRLGGSDPLPPWFSLYMTIGYMKGYSFASSRLLVVPSHTLTLPSGQGPPRPSMGSVSEAASYRPERPTSRLDGMNTIISPLTTKGTCLYFSPWGTNPRESTCTRIPSSATAYCSPRRCYVGRVRSGMRRWPSPTTSTPATWPSCSRPFCDSSRSNPTISAPTLLWAWS